LIIKLSYKTTGIKTNLQFSISVLIGAVFEWLFCPEGREFEQANLQKFKCPGDCLEGGVEASI